MSLRYGAIEVLAPMTTRGASIEDLFKFRWLQGGALSPDGRRAVYAVSSVVKEAGGDYDISQDCGNDPLRRNVGSTICLSEGERTTLYLVDVRSGHIRQITSGKYKESGATFSPDGGTLAFTSDRSGKSQVHVMPVDGGEALQLTDMEQGAARPVWAPDGRRLAFTAGIDCGDQRLRCRNAEPYRVTRHVWRFNGIGNLDLAVTHIFVVELANREIKQLTNGCVVDSDPKWSPDGCRILFSSTMAPDRFDIGLCGIGVVDLDGRVERYMDGWGIESKAWLHNGRRVVVVAARHAGIRGDHPDLFVLNLEAGSAENRTGTLEQSLQGGLEGRSPTVDLRLSRNLPVTRDDKLAYVRVQCGGRMQICRIALSGRESIEAVVCGDRCCTLLDMACDKLLFSVDDICNPPDLYLANLDGSGEERLTRLNEELMAEIQTPRYVPLTCKQADGVEVEGWYVKPSSGAKAPFPSVLWIHGGPHAAQGHTFAFDTLLLNSAGLGVMFFNYRGSSGYGNAFSKAIMGNMGERDYGDLMAGVDSAIAAGLADADRLGVWGNSWGGALSCFIVGKTHRFKAAMPQNPVTEWQSLYGTSDIGVWACVEQLGGHPHEIPDIYRKSSPITYAHNCRTPTLLMQCEEDFRCPANQSEQFYSVLRANGCIVEMERLPQASHMGTTTGPLSVRKAHLESMVGWFTKYITKGYGS